MAEVTGLVIGAVSLASLFSTCIELFDYFELGRNYAYDYHLACTKISLLKVRLEKWGLIHKVENPGHEHPGLRQHWPDEKDVVGRSLFGIKGIFEDASLLAEKYKLIPKPTRTVRPPQSHHLIGLESQTRRQQPRRFAITDWVYLHKRTKWAIHDKKKFERFIDDLSFLMENLEKVTDRTDKPTANTWEARVPPPGQQPDREKPNESATRPSEQSGAGRGANDAQQPAASRHGHLYQGNQENDGSVGLMGNTGPSEKPNTYTGNQKNTNRAIGVMGNSSAADLVTLQGNIGNVAK